MDAFDLIDIMEKTRCPGYDDIHVPKRSLVADKVDVNLIRLSLLIGLKEEQWVELHARRTMGTVVNFMLRWWIWRRRRIMSQTVQ